MAEVLHQYEAMFLLSPAAAPDPETGVKLVQGIVERHGGKIMVIKKWDERKLTYEIKRQKRGTYVIAFFKAPGKAVTPMEREVNLSEEVLRVLILRADHMNEKEMNAVEPQPIQPREERNPWDRPDFNRPQRRDDRGDRPAGDRPPGDRPLATDRPRREEGAPAEAGADKD